MSVESLTRSGQEERGCQDVTVNVERLVHRDPEGSRVRQAVLVNVERLVRKESQVHKDRREQPVHRDPEENLVHVVRQDLPVIHKTVHLPRF